MPKIGCFGSLLATPWVLLKNPLVGPWGFVPRIFDPTHVNLGFSVIPYDFRIETTPKNKANIKGKTSTHKANFRTSWSFFNLSHSNSYD